jgi:hypothetical protein
MATKTASHIRAEQHVRRGWAMVAGQRKLIAQIRAGGHDCFEADELLTLFERTLAIFEEDLAEAEKQARKKTYSLLP